MLNKKIYIYIYMKLNKKKRIKYLGGHEPHDEPLI